MSAHAPRPQPASLGGTLRLCAIGAIAAIALLALGVVFEIVPRDALAAWSTKVLLASVIVAAASAAMTLVLRSGPPPGP